MSTIEAENDQTSEDQGERAEGEAAARLADQITQSFPPVMAGFITGFEATAAEFPQAVGGKVLELRAHCGPLIVRLRVDPEFAELICDEIMDAARAARSAITPAQMTDVDEVAKQAEQGARPVSRLRPLLRRRRIARIVVRAHTTRSAFAREWRWIVRDLRDLRVELTLIRRQRGRPRHVG